LAEQKFVTTPEALRRGVKKLGPKPTSEPKPPEAEAIAGARGGGAPGRTQRGAAKTERRWFIPENG
jgi:hypothetical protein